MQYDFPDHHRRFERKDKLRYARELRKSMTPAEQKLWKALRSRRCGDIKFRRQVPFGGFVVDFCCLRPPLIVEIDGQVHAQKKEYDLVREQMLREKGFTVIRFSNEEVSNDFSGVLETIAHVAAEKTKHIHPPSPLGEGAPAGADEGGKARVA